MNFKTFNELCQHVNEHSVEDMLFPILRNQIIMYQGEIDDSHDIHKLIFQLNKLTEGKYTIILGDTIHSEVTDIKENLMEIQNLYQLLGDKRSKDVLFNILAYRLTRREKYILDAYSYDSEQYFDPSVTLFKEDCVYVDCGGLDGYTTAKFMLHCPSYKRIYLYEPIESYYQDCVKNIQTLQVNNIKVRQAAVADKNGTLKFSVNVRGSSKANDLGDITVQAVCLDEDISEPVSFIKMDIEGSEKAALKGAEQHIKNDTPMLAICVYHLPSDLWEIPIMIAEMNPNYSLLIRHHQTNADETVCYAIPNNYKDISVNHVISLSPSTELACRRLINDLESTENLNLLKVKAHLLKQVENYQRSNFKQLLVISELQDWSQQLSEGKNYLEEQLKNRDNAITELQDWSRQLSEGKSYLEEQLKNKDNAIKELQDWTNQLEEAKKFFIDKVKTCDEELVKYRETIAKQEQTIGVLINETKKLQFHLNEEISKPWYKKVVEKTKE
ncbi:FkbM family methyltransferase [Desulfitobacterium sp. LBE]|uniref:FkbM family methyltransferase n=1 Tax=Desulfitobacterium sp. LBE TaxID=884086 RepID=UPI00119C5094|nr:FkbM family methyltransferase [Desulfitobacterium sp. LBE]TWH59724.1 FkbM family methyltransferase [Desulfitobacterium sp. LBE]